jgi:hypothetical protein
MAPNGELESSGSSQATPSSATFDESMVPPAVTRVAA